MTRSKRRSSTRIGGHSQARARHTPGIALFSLPHCAKAHIRGEIVMWRRPAAVAFRVRAAAAAVLLVASTLAGVATADPAHADYLCAVTVKIPTDVRTIDANGMYNS